LVFPPETPIPSVGIVYGQAARVFLDLVTSFNVGIPRFLDNLPGHNKSGSADGKKVSPSKFKGSGQAETKKTKTTTRNRANMARKSSSISFQRYSYEK